MDGEPSPIPQNDPVFEVVPWTRELSLRAARIDLTAPHDVQLDALRDAIDDGVLPEEAVDALIADGYPELDA